jgi:hypothetical protein
MSGLREFEAKDFMTESPNDFLPHDIFDLVLEKKRVRKKFFVSVRWFCCRLEGFFTTRKMWFTAVDIHSKRVLLTFPNALTGMKILSLSNNFEKSQKTHAMESDIRNFFCQNHKVSH